MPPPPVTPSPHRFVIKKQRTVRKTPLALEQAPHSSTQQFHATPRFTFPPTPRPNPTQNTPRATPSAARYLTSANKSTRRQDNIQSSADDVLHDDLDIQESTETEKIETDPEFFSGDAEDEYGIEQRSIKRQRLSPPAEQDHDEEEDLGEHRRDDDPEDTPSSSLPILSSPPAPRHRPVSSTASRFLLSTPFPPSTPASSVSNQTTFVKPPRFRPPDSDTQAQSTTDPLPDQFSPHRRGQKYIPGGLADEVRGWLFNIESAIPSNHTQRLKDPWPLKLLVDEISGDTRAGMTLVRGRQIQIVDGKDVADTVHELKVILASEGASTGLQKGSRVELGKIVGIKGPVWETVIEGERWGVGVDWKALP